MSYSFTVRGHDKEAAKAKVVAQMDMIVKLHQPVHGADAAQAVAAAHAFIDVLNDVEAKDVIVTMIGSLMGVWDGIDLALVQGASVNVNAYLSLREV